MDINDILNSLGIDLTNPEAKRGAVEAIQAILNSRTPPPKTGGGGGASAAKEIDVEIDPDLLQPSQKFNQPENDEDIEIEDEEDILSQIKSNEAEDDLDNEGNSSEDNTSKSESDSDTSDEESSSSGEGKAGGSEDDTEQNQAAEDENSEESEIGEQENSEEDSEIPEEQAEDESGSESTTGENSDMSDEKAETEDDKTEAEPDEEDFLDDELKNSYDDQELNTKKEARRIKRERTLAAAKTALEKAKIKNVSQALIRELEKSIEALESLTEAKSKSLSDISDEEFNLIINRVFDAISAVGDDDLTFTTDKEREIRAQEIKTDLGSRETQQELSDEDIAAIRAETQAVKAREKETAIFRKPTRSSFKGFKEFLNSLYRAIALQVQTNEVQDDTWSAINRRYSGTGVLKQGQRKNDLPNNKIPIIDFYFDQSGSWDEQDIAAGKKAVESLVDMEEKGQIKINIYYFANKVHNDAISARNEGGTRAWNEIIKNIITTQATNVVIMTDSDMEDWWEGKSNGEPALKYTVPGYVWYLWRNGDNAPRLPRDLKGRGGVQQFSFKQGDV
jgi:hypothetical protein